MSHQILEELPHKEREIYNNESIVVEGNCSVVI